MKPDSTLPAPVSYPNLPVTAIRPSDSLAYAGGLDKRIGPSSGADLSLSNLLPARAVRAR